MTPHRRQPFRVGLDDDGKRLDAVCRRLLPGLNLGDIQKAIRAGDIRIGGVRAKPEVRVSHGDSLEVYAALVAKGLGGPERRRTAKKKPRRWDGGGLKDLVVRENALITVFNKPRGLLVHGPASLDAMVKSSFTGEALSFQPGPLHRLDQNTSGLVVFSKSLEGARVFSSLLKAGRVDKEYLALLRGTLGKNTTCREPLLKNAETGLVAVSAEGQTAVTHFQPLFSARGLTLALCLLETGRTHQIRVHAKVIDHPLAGDGRYGGGQLEGGFVLHAWRLWFPVEGSDLGPSPLTAPLPTQSVRALRSHLGLEPERMRNLLSQVGRG